MPNPRMLSLGEADGRPYKYYGPSSRIACRIVADPADPKLATLIALCEQKLGAGQIVFPPGLVAWVTKNATYYLF